MSFAEWSNQKKKEREEKNPSQISPSPTQVSSDKKELISFEEWSNKKHSNAEAGGTKANTTSGQNGWQKYLDDQASAKQQEAEEKENESFWDKLGRWLGDTGATDTTLPMGNTGQIVHDVRNDTSYTKPSDDWSDDQRYEFGALYLESPEKAYAYAERINKENAKAKEEDEIKKIQDSATSNIWAGAAHTAGAVVSSGLALADYLKMLVDSAAGKDPLESDGIVSPFEYSTAVQESIATGLNDAYGTLNESIPVIGGKGWGDVYGLGTSIAQSALSGYTLGPAGTLVSYFGQGAASGMQDALERGASEGQAALYGAALGAFEGIAEQIGIDNLFKMGSASTLKGLLKNIAKQAGAEGLEEALTTFLSTMADDFIMQDKSQLNQLAAQYMSLGMSEEEAKKQAAKDIWEGLAFDALAGAISGGVHGGAQTGIQTGISNHYAEKYFGNQSQDLVNDALNSPNSSVQEIGQKYQEKLNSGQTLSGWNLNELLEVTDTDKIQTAIQQRLENLGETGDVRGLAEIIAKEQSGEELTKSERATLENSQFGRDVYYEIERRKLNKSDDANKWMESVGTRRTSPELYNKTEYVPKKTTEALPGTTQPTESKESKYKSSEDGKTTLKGEAVSILGVESIKNGEITVRLKNGKAVNASDLEFGSHTEALMYDIVGRMEASARTANMILRTVKPSNEALARMYYNSLPLAYEYGKIGYEAGLKNVKLPLNVKNNVYTRGRIDAMLQARVNTPQTNSTQDGTSKTDSGIIYEDGFVYDEASANEMQRVSMAHIEVINKMTNLEVHIFESKVENGKRVAYVNGELVSAPNGYFKDGNKIYIDFNAGNNGEGAMLYTMSHEITHYIREWNAKGFKELGDFLIEQYGKKGENVEYLLNKQRQKIKKRYAAEGKALPSEAKLNDMAYEEMVADAMSDMLTDPNAYEKLAKLKQQNKTLWEKVGEAIKAVLDKFKAALGVYKERDVAVAREANSVREFSSKAYEKLQDLYIKAFVEADANYAEAERTLSDNGITVDPSTESASIYSVRDVLDDDQRQNVAKALATRFNVTQKEALQWLSAETSLASLILNPKYSQYLDYEPDPNEVAIKTNSDYPQGTVDFSPICAKRREFTAVMNNVLRLFKNHVFAATDLAKIRSIMQEEGMTIPCGICYVEDRRQLDTIVAQNFIDSLKLYREGSKTRPDGKAFNTNQLKGLKLTDGDSYTPTVYELVSLEGLNVLKEKNPSMAEAWIKFNNARGMQSVRLLANEAEYKRQILKYGKQTVKAKNDKGGLRIYSFSDAEMFHLIDIIQVITDSATVGLSLQGYTKVNEYAKAVKDTGEKLNRSLIPKGELGYHIEDGKVVLDYDTVEGIDINHPDFFDNKDNPNVGNITIGVSDTQIRAAMVSDFVDQIIPFHTGQSEDVLGEKGISTWSNYKDFQTEKDIATGKVSDHQINIYTEVLQPLEKEGKPITKRTFVEKFLQVCKENNLTPRFSQFLNTNANGEFVYTEGYHKMLVDFKTFAQTEVGEYLPQMPVKPIFDNEYITKILKDYVKSQEVKDAELAKSMPKVIDRITNEIIKPSETKFSDRDSDYLDAVNRGDMATAQKMVDEAAKEAGYTIKAYHGTNADFTVFDKNRVGKGNDQYGAGFYFASNPDVTEGYGTKRYDTYLDIKKPINLISKPGGKGKTLYDVRITQAQAYQILKRHPLMYDPENSPLGDFYDKYWEVGAKEWMVRDLAKNYDSIGLLDGDVILYRDYPNELHEAIRDVLGYDGVQVYFETDAMVDERNDYFYVAWFDNQMKSSDPVVRDDNGKVIPLSERFNPKNSDIRYSDRDSEGNTLSKEQQEFFKDSKVRDENGNLKYLYHGTKHGGFTKFEVTDDIGYFFTDSEMNAASYSGTLGEFAPSNTAEDEIEALKYALYGEEKQANYAVYLNLTNPLIINGNGSHWSKVFDYYEGGKFVAYEDLTEEQKQRFIDNGYDEGYMGAFRAKSGRSHRVFDVANYRMIRSNKTRDWVKEAQNRGFDGVIFKNIVDSGSQWSSDAYESNVYVAFNSNQIKSVNNKTPTSDPDIRYSVREEFYKEFDEWDKKDTNKVFTVGTTSESLRSIGMKDQSIILRSGTVLQKVNKHSEITFDTFKGIPELLEHPIIVQFSDAIDSKTKKPKYESRITVLGELYADGKPILVSLELLPTNQKKTAVLDFSVVVSAYAKDTLQQYINENSILYIEPNKKRTNKWLSLNRLSLPLGENQYGSIRIISYSDGKVKVQNKKNMTPMEIAMRKAGIIDEFGDVKHSERDPNATSNRTILANALEAAAQNDLEKTKLNQYKRKIALIESEQARLKKIKASLKNLYFAKGPKDTAKIESLQESARMIENRINTYDRQLLNLEATEALRALLQREKQAAYNEAKKEGQEALRKQKEKNAATVKELMNRNYDSRQKATESRNKTAVKAKIKKVVHDLNKLLLNPTKDQHVPIGLQKVVAEALDTINMDSMNAEERVAYYNDLISKSSDPDEIAMLTKKRDFFAYRDANFKDRITELKNAYAEFKESDDPLIRNAHNDAIADLIKNTADEVGNKSLKDMSLSQLEQVYDMYKAILATVRNSNKLFKEGKQETVTENSDAVKLEVRSVGGHKDRVLKMTKFLKKFGWDMLKPLTAMKVIGSTTFERLFNNVRAAEDTWAVDVNEAKKYFDDIASKYGYNKWDLKKYYTFKDSAGTNISLSLEQIMSLYAYSKREQADKHLEFGGFIFDDSIEVVEKNKLGIPLKYEVNDANPYRLRKEHLLDITNALTKEQKDFVDAMQTYLSDVMGAKGNEVSLAMYDIKLYKEKNYFPLKTSRYFREFDPEKNATPKIKNSGFSKKTVPQAGNPIVLSNFMDVWASHVNDMSMYHAFVLPLEDFMRVYNYSSTIGGYDSVQQYIKNAYGAQANQYIERLMDDLNGGARVDSSAGIINKGLSLFKKASVFASASVVVQQPSAIARALAYINPKYFVKATPEALNIGKHKALWAEVKKYAPVAVIKEMGYFDTGVGRSTVDWIKGNQTFMDKMDDVLSKAPALADELCWVHIWEAVKRETIATKKIKYGTEDFFNECGRRFTEVITNTQVYDSVLSRSGMMRSKDTGMKMATAFMAEPTTTVNMMVDGIIQGIRGNKKFTAATVGAVSASIILNSILVSLVYAARDDDEDETYLEKYIGSLTSELLDGFNPLTYIPFVKDIWSIAQGYDVERSDMSVISKLWESIESLFNEDKSGLDKVLEVAGSISSLFGIPLKNIIRDAKGMYSLTKTILSGVPTTEAGIGYAVEDAFKSSIPLWDRLHESDSKTDKLYDAIMSGDQNQINRVKATYKSEQKLETALKTALRENDSRIKRAAQARLDGNILEYARIAKEIIAEGHFSQDTVVGAINAEISAIKKAQLDPTESTDDKDEVTSIYKADDINVAFNNGDKALALSIIDDLVKTKVANGMDETKAKSSLRSSMTSYWKPLYLEAAKSGNKAEMQRIKQILFYSGLYGSAADVVKAVKGWTK